MDIYAWVNHNRARDHWAPNAHRLRRYGLTYAPHHLTCMVTMSTVFGDGLAGCTEAIEALRGAGIPCIPACKLFAPRIVEHSHATWYDVAAWQQAADRIRELLVLRSPEDPRIAIDLEPPGTWTPRYPTRGHIGGPKCDEEYALATAMAPFIEVLDSPGVIPMILPWGHEYAASQIAVAASPRAVAMDEFTYHCPIAPEYWTHYEQRRDACAAMHRTYLPGFFAEALRNPDFLDECQDRGLIALWVFFRTWEGGDEPDDFLLPRWWDRPDDSIASGSSLTLDTPKIVV